MSDDRKLFSNDCNEKVLRKKILMKKMLIRLVFIFLMSHDALLYIA